MSERRVILHIPGDEKEYSLFPASPFDRRYDLNNGWAKTLLRDLINQAVKEEQKITAGMLIEHSPIYAFNLARLSRFTAYNHHVPGLVDAVATLITAVVDADIQYVQPGTVARLTIYDSSNPLHRLSTRPHPYDQKQMIESVFEDNDYGDNCRAAAMKLTNVLRRALADKDPELDLRLLEGRILTAFQRNTTPFWILQLLPESLEFLNSVRSQYVPKQLISDFRQKVRHADRADYGKGLPDIGRAGRNTVFTIA